jgi:hypothetical protein
MGLIGCFVYIYIYISYTWIHNGDVLWDIKINVILGMSEIVFSIKCHHLNGKTADKLLDFEKPIFKQSKVTLENGVCKLTIYQNLGDCHDDCPKIGDTVP